MDKSNYFCIYRVADFDDTKYLGHDIRNHWYCEDVNVDTIIFNEDGKFYSIIYEFEEWIRNFDGFTHIDIIKLEPPQLMNVNAEVMVNLLHTLGEIFNLKSFSEIIAEI